MKFAVLAAIVGSALMVAATPVNVTAEDRSLHLSKRRFPKKGASFNFASTVAPLGDAVSWAYNWNFRSDGPLPGGVEFVPMIWGTDQVHLNGFHENMDAQVNAGSVQYLLGFNEPDHPQQSNMSPQQAVDGWMEHVQPYAARGIKLIAPAVTNGAAPMGLAWLDEFLRLCSGRCQIDGIAVHWYDQAWNTGYFQNYMGDLARYGKPVWITEYKAFGSNDEQSNFIRSMLPWIGGQDHIFRHAYFADIEGELIQGGGLTSVGSTFATA